ncbi:MAG: hypothetical protein R3D03_01395 [Geminicoccaceae bacterium]
MDELPQVAICADCGRRRHWRSAGRWSVQDSPSSVPPNSPDPFASIRNILTDAFGGVR